MKIKYERKERRVVSKRRRKKLVVSGTRSVTDNCPEHDNSYLSRAFVRNTSHGKVKGRFDFYWFKADGYAKYLKVFGIYVYCCHLEARKHALSNSTMKYLVYLVLAMLDSIGIESLPTENI